MMLHYNFDRIFKARGIEKPFVFLINAGISRQFASKIYNNKVKRLNFDVMERLCVLLNCTPNDFTEWIPEKNTSVPADHALRMLEKSDKAIDFTQKLNAIPLGKMEDISNLIDAYLKKTNE
ncbi:MAG: helix-turn-helix transcriptional regulator [Bacteroidales bacterium]|nr:helix-turn-helix transcriptional regulator [Bacteroidales bacterium]